MGRIYGYARISTDQQNIDRQIRNIKSKYPEAIIVQETYTGRKLERPEWMKLYKKVAEGDTIVFDEVSRMSRNAEDGFSLYKELFDRNVSLVFLKESHIDTNSYRDAMQGAFSIDISSGDSATDELVSSIMSALNRFMMNKVEKDIYKAFEQAENEIQFLKQRTKEGMETARLNGKQIGRQTGAVVTTKRSIEAKKKIRKYGKDFDGTLKDTEVMKLTGLARNTYYKYKKELLAED